MRLTQIMIVEDEALIAMRQMMDLAAEGFMLCGWVSSGEEAVQLAKEKRPDVALMHVRLTGKIDGIEAMRQIREFSSMPVVFVTGFYDEKMQAQVLEMLPSTCLLKPVESSEIVMAIRAMMNGVSSRDSVS